MSDTLQKMIGETLQKPQAVMEKPQPVLAGEWALFLDIDGTLLEHAEHPDAVSVSDELRSLLQGLDRKLNGALAFITGRSVSAVDHLFQPLKLRAAGLYGLEHRLLPDDDVEIADEPADIAALADEIEAELGRGAYIERKGRVLAIHTRAAPHLLPRATQLVEQALAGLPKGYRVVAGNAGVELLPLEAAKGAAIRRFMEIAPFAGRRPVFLGDDTSDENGFETINDAGGISIRVKPPAQTTAQYGLAGVAETLAWLRGQL
ncbi:MULTISPECIES: trehalose-phosphatase [unclassified Mesorhizobium]|jgi:trehalose 6-phosphate phosphatase|uniref:trehalose-phosphatase n=1 Tax=unclassified Mesorhizobium TaxID=325217 RepID=UPI000FD2DCF2|nr:MULTISPECIES: trehalose-phosphatase [unclassified Mesorhizobium]AZV21248.1 trehalose-phosphatase [Mesorhizobium sp. M7A.F.Ce.TU.012.03.2.1]RUU87439.1 trehalose-phosphatase [Mesorhizobium sp. M7A.F.Ca.MR.176.00.0.0]RWB07072.1 MAG: trehalose-phosphatase [Mesorhizobium sp.]RWB13048.1 MAG: trehalose-phosphatase [Mesorhizobium sp.]RWN12259.1 MAG: trehalose-phosphatase [Mesorhizobium sp.]